MLVVVEDCVVAFGSNNNLVAFVIDQSPQIDQLIRNYCANLDVVCFCCFNEFPFNAFLSFVVLERNSVSLLEGSRFNMALLMDSARPYT